MRGLNDPGKDPVDETSEMTGPERYLRPGEELRIYSTDIQIKKFRFDACLTSHRLFLIDQNEKKPGITAKEIPVDSVAEAHLEQSSLQEPILVLSIRTSDDDVRTMKMIFVHTGEDRNKEIEEWIHLVQHGCIDAGTIPPAGIAESAGARKTPQVAPEVRTLSDTIIFPAARSGQYPADERKIPAGVPPQRPTADSSPQPARSPAIPSPPQVQSASTTQIMFCFHCGRRLPPGSNFCPFCGTRMHQPVHHEESHLKMPLHTPRTDRSHSEQNQPEPKKGWRRLFGR